jgi:hypothetical protein
MVSCRLFDRRRITDFRSFLGETEFRKEYFANHDVGDFSSSFYFYLFFSSIVLSARFQDGGRCPSASIRAPGQDGE